MYGVIDCATGKDPNDESLTIERVLDLLQSGWRVIPNITVGEVSPVLLPGQDANTKRKIDLWISPTEPLAPLSTFIEALIAAKDEGGDWVTLNMLALFLTGQRLDALMGEEDVPATDDNLEQEAGGDEHVWPVPEQEVH